MSSLFQFFFFLTVHNSTGIYFADGAPSFGSNTSNFDGFEGKVKSFAIADDGSRFAWIADGQWV